MWEHFILQSSIKGQKIKELIYKVGNFFFKVCFIYIQLILEQYKSDPGVGPIVHGFLKILNILVLHNPRLVESENADC